MLYFEFKLRSLIVIIPRYSYEWVTIWFQHFTFCQRRAAAAFETRALQTGREGGSLRLHGDAVFLLACAWVRGAVSHSQEEILSVLDSHNHTLTDRSQIRTTAQRERERAIERDGKSVLSVAGCEFVSEGRGTVTPSDFFHTSVYTTWLRWQYFTRSFTSHTVYDEVAFNFCSTTPVSLSLVCVFGF